MLINPSQTLITNRWLSVFLFIIIATLLSALVGWLRAGEGFNLVPSTKGIST